GVPTARYGVFDDAKEANAFLRELPGPWVVKTDGLAAGKGVLVTDSITEAEGDIAAKLSGESFGDAGRRVVVEEGLVGPECSLLALCDGRRISALAPAQDFKRIADGDEGPNTGGMGAYSPTPVVDDRVVDRVLDEAVEPLVAALRRRGIDYRGVLYAGLILTVDGPRVLEYNVRFGDPETQVVLPRLTEDLTGLLAEAAAGRLRTEPRFSADAAVCVVLAAPGYPGTPRTGDPIEGLDEAAVLPGVTVLHAGTALDDQGRFVTAGGRVLGVTGTGPTVAQARDRAYAGVARIGWDGMQHRTDIALAAAGPAPEFVFEGSVPSVADVLRAPAGGPTVGGAG
ncbi:MAG TPA: phosphoribosylamine--glycine ligase, partial [Acidimicrobiales bacterium]|nr:phosphoribosylamine--glycine ligase [Acidimicrobiales bacterium]